MSRNYRKARYVIDRWLDSVLGPPRMRSPRSLNSKGQPDFEIQEAACVAMIEAVEGFTSVRPLLIKFFGGDGLTEPDEVVAVWEFVARLEEIVSKQIYLYVNPDEPPFDYTMVTAEECAERMGKTVRTVERLCKEGKLQGAEMVNQRWRIPYGSMVHAMHSPERRNRKNRKKSVPSETTGGEESSYVA